MNQLQTKPEKSPFADGERLGSGLCSGDTLWLEAGRSYQGPLLLKNLQHIRIAGKGPFPAVIDAGDGDGIIVENCRDICISGLEVRGTGWRKNKGDGVRVTGSQAVRLCELEVSGVREGILLRDGCENVEITGCFVHDAGLVGIATGGEIINHNIRIAHCRTYDCAGDPLLYQSHTGSGIVLGRTHDAVIEYCEAAGNGWAQRQRYANGPIGMWCWGRCERILFRYCISRDNRTQPGAVDGGGFDFDGSVCDCLMEYNYSYNNEGAGYLLCEYGSGEKWDNNLVRYCVSVNDAKRVQQYGSVHYCGHIGRKIDRGVVEDSLLIPASGRPAVMNDFMAEESQGNAVNTCVMVTDTVRPVASDNPVVSFLDNTEYIDPVLHAALLKAAPRLSDPRRIGELPVFALLESGRCAQALDTQGPSALFGEPNEGIDDASGLVNLSLDLGGLDLEGSDVRGDVTLHYDSVDPGMAACFSGRSSLDFPVSWEDAKTPYVLRAYARLKSPSVSAYLYMTDDSGRERRAYFGGSCAGYVVTKMEFTGEGDVGRRIGIRVEDGCLLVQQIEIVEIRGRQARQTCEISNPDEWRSFGDVETRDGGCFILHDDSLICRELQMNRPVTFHARVRGRGRLQFGEECIEFDEPEENGIRLRLEKPADRVLLCLSHLGEPEGELRVEDMRWEQP